MNTTKPKSKNSTIDSIETETAKSIESETSLPAKKVAAKKAPKKQATAKSAEFAEPEINVKKAESEAKKPLKKKKAAKAKVIRDSFSFPEEDYQKISALKKTCLSAGVHVKKSEILRAGLHLLTTLDIENLKQALEQVEKVKTGRPSASES